MATTSLTITNESKQTFDEIKGKLFERYGMAPTNTVLFDLLVKYVAINIKDFVDKKLGGF